jgi:CheY-like chemotaxis protein
VSVILLADDSPHAQRMGERILRDEGYEVVTAGDGETALARLDGSDPDVVIADVSLPGRTGYQICEQVKRDPRHRHARVILVAGLLERIDDEAAARADLVLKKPFEASALLGAVKPLVEAAQAARATSGAAVDPERVRAAVIVAVDRALPKIIDELTERVLAALRHPD